MSRFKVSRAGDRSRIRGLNRQFSISGFQALFVLLFDAFDDCQAGHGGAAGVILVRMRITKKHLHAFTDGRRDMTIISTYHFITEIDKIGKRIVQFFGINLIKRRNG